MSPLRRQFRYGPSILLSIFLLTTHINTRVAQNETVTVVPTTSSGISIHPTTTAFDLAITAVTTTETTNPPPLAVTISITDDDEGSPNDDGRSITGAVIIIRCRFNNRLSRFHEPNIYISGLNRQGSYTGQERISTDRIVASTRWDNLSKYMIVPNYKEIDEAFVDFTIKDAEDIDSGKYKCSLENTNRGNLLLSEDEMDLIIFVNTDTVILVGAGGNGDLLIRENQDTTLICVAIGGSRPDLSLRLANGTELTFKIHETERELRSGGNLPIYTSEVTLKPNFVTSIENLTCISRVEGHREVTDQSLISIIPATSPNMSIGEHRVDEEDYLFSSNTSVTDNEVRNGPSTNSGAQTTRQQSVTASKNTTNPLCPTLAQWGSSIMKLDQIEQLEQSSSSTKVTPLIITEIWLVNVIKAVFNQKLR